MSGSPMDKLWAPWRIGYIQSAQKKPKKQQCIFCAAGKGKKEHVLFTTAHSMALLNIYPYNNGHTMVAPLRHVGEWGALTPEEGADLFTSVSRVMRGLDAVLRPEGYNVGVNIGRVAGAGIPGHMHVHIVPRWNGDTNFMPVMNATKVISQSLDELHRLFADADRHLREK